MIARTRKFIGDLSETFWLIPAVMVLIGIATALGLLQIDGSGLISSTILDSRWLYDGGGTGARTLLGAVASSTIGVAGTVFSITIAALSLAAGQMGPRLLRNFTRDRGNQITLGIFLGTFSYALIVLRSVRTQDEGAFVPHLALSVSIVLAFVCVATLVYFVGHMASRINVDTVIELVSEDVRAAIANLTTEKQQPLPPPKAIWRNAEPVLDARYGYLQQFDGDGLADWAAEHSTAIRLLVRPGDYVFPDAPIALISPMVDGAGEAIRAATALGSRRGSTADLEFSIRQLVEVAVRALSPGINDPHTAMSVLDRLGAALCELAPRTLTSGVYLREDRPVLVVANPDYTGVTNAMFHMIRQNAVNSTAVLIRLLDVLASVVSCEHEPLRVLSLQGHADLVLGDAERHISTPADLTDIRARHARFVAMKIHGPFGALEPLEQPTNCA
ncbi:DUF2254 domain-containing protein [Bradyrhizobium sp. 83002]|uniref:DUF2254 domain-containing protein n=1 Tax=Bradyrhizobium aeschynomenes TaxID=2734909 RepID=UPI0015583144|nr:DUF2254 domain-containing protein [Bradyrhizobium aeschynomenes]NPU13157.1 DUF2254 domain-containing protein [Bradyrhizobium aeschynomenes]